MKDNKRYKNNTLRANAEDKCASCAHNIGVVVMDCECACTGVEEIADEGRIVVICTDYEPKPNKNNGRSTEL